MEAPTWAVQALTWLALIALFHYLTTTLGRGRRRHKQKHLPGPKPWPIIGNLNLVGSVPHQSFHYLSQKYGEIMQLKFGSFPIVVISSPEMAKEILQTHDQTFASRPALVAGKYTSYNYSNMLWAPYGPYCRQARRIYLNELFSQKRIDSYEYIRMEERHALMSRLYALSGKETVIREELVRFTLANITRMALGGKYFCVSESDRSFSKEKLEELKEMMEEWFLLNGVFNIGDWIPWLSFLDLQGYVKRMKALRKKFNRFHDIVIADHKAKREADKDNFVAKDMVDVVLQLADDPNLEVKINSDGVKGLIQANPETGKEVEDSDDVEGGNGAGLASEMDYEDTFGAERSMESLFVDIDNYSSLDLVRAWSNEVHFLILYYGLYLIFIVLDVM
ncbi:hypothetical protein RHSIM_Rhsim09G0024100 [Rhododendron simsii]|uniref:Uncharacterized protein n=1 Tax=Rhododendron simsii TaxID=118357 RepID=A0A834GIB7_RHOSS|nr:hypothetical protein RHSIM_Rhsim09G0024100 [Rhododendron simsii]